MGGRWTAGNRPELSRPNGRGRDHPARSPAGDRPTSPRHLWPDVAASAGRPPAARARIIPRPGPEPAAVGPLTTTPCGAGARPGGAHDRKAPLARGPTRPDQSQRLCAEAGGRCPRSRHRPVPPVPQPPARSPGGGGRGAGGARGQERGGPTRSHPEPGRDPPQRRRVLGGRPPGRRGRRGCPPVPVPGPCSPVRAPRSAPGAAGAGRTPGFWYTTTATYVRGAGWSSGSSLGS